MHCIESVGTDDKNYCVAWERNEPTPCVFIIYAFVIPVLSVFGLCANFINAIVFSRPKMTPSAFSYLAALSWMDCCSCFLITMTAISRSVFYNCIWWLTYDLKWQTPLFGITTGAANLILACVSLDRWIYLRHGIPNGIPPRFCRRKIARRMIVAVIIFSGVLNMPYFFIFDINADGTFTTTEFYGSEYYRIHNWLTFAVLAVLPVIFLAIGNVAIIVAFRRWTKQGEVCRGKCNKAKKSDQIAMKKRYQHQRKLTTTIIIVITLYLVGELPAHLTSRKSAVNLLFGGDMSKVDLDLMERLEIICILLNALQLSLNIIVYAIINPYFIPEFFLCLRGTSDVCFRILCFTTIASCCERLFCGRNKIVTNSDVECDSVGTIPTRKVTSPKRKALNSWGDEEYSRSSIGLGGGGGCVIGGVELRHKTTTVDIERPSYMNRSSGDGQSWNENLHVDWVWKRSSSLGDFTFDNFAMSSDECEKDVQNIDSESYVTIRKRHSMGS